MNKIEQIIFGDPTFSEIFGSRCTLEPVRTIYSLPPTSALVKVPKN